MNKFGGWQIRSLGELTENFDGLRVPVKESERRPGPFPYYGASGIVDYVDKYLFDGEYLLIAEDGENLRTRNTPLAFLANGKFWVNNHAHIVRGNGEADTRFLMYSLLEADISGYLTGSTIPKLTQGNLNRIPLAVPPLPEQHDIVHVLGALDDKIELNRRMNETLEAMARALFKSWFVDFDPVRAKSGGRDPGLPKEIADLFPDRFVDSELGEIPKGWRLGIIGDTLELSRKSMIPGKFPDETFDHYSIPAFDGGRSPKKEPGNSIKSNKFLVLPGCVLLSKLNPRIPRIWLPTLTEKRRAVCSTEFLVAVPKSGFYPEYLFCLFSSEFFMEKFATLVTGTSGSHQRVRSESLLDVSCVLPKKFIVDKFSNIVTLLFKYVAGNLVESDNLAHLRGILLPKLINGNLRVNGRLI